MPILNRQRTIRRSDTDAGVSLRKPRRWYSDDGEGDDSQNSDGADAPPTDDKRGLEDMTAEELVLEVRKTRSEAKGYRLDKRELEQKVSDIESKLTKAEQSRKAQLERDQNFEALSREQEQELEELRIKAKKADRLEQSVKESNEMRVAKIPEHMRSLVPELSPEGTSKWLDTNESKLTAPPIPDLDGGAGGRGKGGGKKPGLSSEEKIMAAKVGMTEEEYSARK